MHRQLLPKCSVRDICRAAVAPSGRNIFIIEMPQKETSEGWMKMASVFPEPQGPASKPAKPGWSDVCPKTPFLEAVGLLDIPVRPEFLTSHRLPSTHPPGC
ncbi:unnamed protein product [Rangifer tarandus platyrhynchus]|uniref:Uncharacterized protein n=1 Tax=Rangifer tarandus platyrhynchus TaxID=3082113 RepID=A0ABN8ZKI2_RANTA|nr:unnamed protein product [Rangifer tarandus platyrhynchus]